MIQIIPNWHPILVHFTVALFTISILLFLISSVLKTGKLQNQCATVAYWNLWIGVLFTIATLIAGWNAYSTVNHDTASHIQMTTHKNWAFITSGIFLIFALWSYVERKQPKPRVLFVLLGLVAGSSLGVTAWHGGETVYRYGLGVMSLPKSNGKGRSSHTHKSGSEHKITNPQSKSDQSMNKQDSGAVKTPENNLDHSHGEIDNEQSKGPKLNNNTDPHNNDHVH